MCRAWDLVEGVDCGLAMEGDKDRGRLERTLDGRVRGKELTSDSWFVGNS